MKNLADLSGSIFLTGGTGFVGKSILSLKKRNFLPGISLTVLARDPESFLEANPEFSSIDGVGFVVGDVRDFSFPDRKFDYIFHGAAPAKAMPPGVERDIVINGTRRVLDFAALSGSRRLLFLSSGAVYGPASQSLDKIPEDFPCSPATEYGIAKLEAENLCLSSPVDSVIARGFAFTGPYLNRNIHFAIGNFIQDCLDDRPIQINGDGTPYRSYLYADDMIEWLFTLLFKGRSNTAYNVGSDQAVSIAELAALVRDLLNPSLPIIIRGKKSEGGGVQKYVPDISRCCQELGLKVRNDLCESIVKSTTGK